jgi:hypothetical protein
LRSSWLFCRSLSRSFFLDCVLDASRGNGLIRIIYKKILRVIPNRVKSHIMMTSCHTKCLKISLSEAVAKRFTFKAISVLDFRIQIDFINNFFSFIFLNVHSDILWLLSLIYASLLIQFYFHFSSLFFRELSIWGDICIVEYCHLLLI